MAPPRWVKFLLAATDCIVLWRVLGWVLRFCGSSHYAFVRVRICPCAITSGEAPPSRYARLHNDHTSGRAYSRPMYTGRLQTAT
ncbi:hypothetical protein BD413DRAFT_231275 [Trametes elegans]|nr:hypothetical protein BD413DRAFT_231275 [Trametes elegans]